MAIFYTKCHLDSRVIRIPYVGSSHRRHRRVAIRGEPRRPEGLRAVPPGLQVHRRHRVHRRRRGHPPERPQTGLDTPGLVPAPPRARLRRILPEMDRKCRSFAVRELREWRRHAGGPCRIAVSTKTPGGSARGKRPGHGDHARPPRGHQRSPGRDRGDLARPAGRRARCGATSDHEALRLRPRAEPRSPPAIPAVRRHLPRHGADSAHLRARIHEP